MSERRPAGGRLPLLRPEQLDARQRTVYDTVAGGPRAGGPFRLTDDRGCLLGPFNALLFAPGIGDAVQRLGAALRFEGSLPARTRELVICAVAAHWRCDYEWYAHSRVAAAVGVTAAELELLRKEAPLPGLAPADSAALALARALLRDRQVGEDVYAPAVAHHGEAGAVELALLVGYYQALAGLLAAFDVPAPGGDPPAARDPIETSGPARRRVEPSETSAASTPVRPDHDRHDRPAGGPP